MYPSAEPSQISGSASSVALLRSPSTQSPVSQISHGEHAPSSVQSSLVPPSSPPSSPLGWLSSMGLSLTHAPNSSPIQRYGIVTPDSAERIPTSRTPAYD